MVKVKTTKSVRSAAVPTQEKAGEILQHGEVRGRKLTGRQGRFFGMLRGGGTPTRMGRDKARRRRRRRDHRK